MKFTRLVFLAILPCASLVTGFSQSRIVGSLGIKTTAVDTLKPQYCSDKLDTIGFYITEADSALKQDQFKLEIDDGDFPFKLVNVKNKWVILLDPGAFKSSYSGKDLNPVFLLSYPGSKTILIEFVDQCGKTTAPKTKPPDPLAFITENILKPHKLQFKKYQLARSGDTTFLFLNSDLRILDGTAFPDCVEDNAFFRIFIVAKKDEFSKVEVFADNNYSSGSGSDFGIQGTSKNADEPVFEFLTDSVAKGPFRGGIDVRVVLYKRKAGEKKDLYEKESKFSLNSCNTPIHASILGGFYYSSLNDPTNIVQDVIPGSATKTLYADNSKSQSALTIMAVFYPKPRNRNYVQKQLSFMQKWGVAFGTKISQNLFQDILLGLNYDFTKGASFTGGVQFGKHAVVRGYDNFIFGKTPYDAVFSNDKITQQWGFGLFLGVTIDFRVIAAMRFASKRENDLNKGSTE